MNGENKTRVMGGADFSKASKRNIGRAEFTVEHPRLDTTTKTSVKAETSYRNTEISYLGGNGSGRTGSGGGGKPTQSPTPSGTGTPSGAAQRSPHRHPHAAAVHR
ncbi:hypothetical protein ACF1A5_07735 [Streptomyces sp. NPDC014864]|uniref:hypothetical protein n=1 Tax=Streptomyces sp. NPDC014864 TaxID=3364924 RepID=UPI0036FB9D64